jgi:4-oxalocrotonate tautomerase
MPFISVKISKPALAAPVAATVARLTAELLGKDPRVTAITVETVAPEQWFVAGKSLAEQGRASFFLDIRITDGTNTKGEKAAYVAAVFREMAGLLGALHEESYVHVHDVRAEAYGYGGLTQERRYIAATPAPGSPGNR